MSNFNAEIFVSAQMEKQMVNMHMDFGMRIVSECAKLYGFDADEAVRALNIGLLKMEKKPVAKKSPLLKKVKQVKASFPIPFNGVAIEGCCVGLRFNRGLYTQCQGKPASESGFCKGCQAQADKNVNGKPDCGTIGERLMSGLYDFQDPKGKTPIAFLTILKKLKLSEDTVKEEAGKLNININPEHFEFIAIEKKKGRKSSNVEKIEKKDKKEKGRPKKSKKILELEGDSSDLFASLVAQANAESECDSEPISESEQESDDIIIESKPNKKNNDEKKAQKEAEKEAKRLAAEAKKEEERKAKEAQKEAEKEAKRLAAEAKKEEERKEKEAKRLAIEAEKEAKRLAIEAEKKAKEEAKLTKKESPKPKKEEKKDDGEPDVVKRFEYEGKKYLKSKKTGIVYNLDQDVVGKWNEETQKIVFYENESEAEEESEDEYEEE